MDAISFWHWLTTLTVVATLVLASIPTLQKAGWSGWWCLLWFVPLVNVVFLWVFAFGKWPNEPRVAKAAE